MCSNEEVPQGVSGFFLYFSNAHLRQLLPHLRVMDGDSIAEAQGLFGSNVDVQE